MTGNLTDEAYARAALTYLAEPADRWLGQLIGAHGAALTLDAIKTGQLPRTAQLPRARRLDPAARNPRRGQLPKERPSRPCSPPCGARPAPARQAVPSVPAGRDGTLAGPAADLPAPADILAFRQAGIRLVCPGDPEWPGQLADLGDEQPYALWLRGSADLRFNCLRSVAIVGSRAATAYGSYVTAEIAASVATRGLAVVSGGAFGVDAAAHRGALGADGVTVVVLACGVDVAVSGCPHRPVRASGRPGRRSSASGRPAPT